MTIKYQPQGIPISSSFAVNALVTQTAINAPNTASFAEYTLSPPGPSGSQYKIIIGSIQGT